MAGGRPRIYKSVEDLESAIDSYFESITDDNDIFVAPPSVNMLALKLGFADKSTLYDYRDYKEFSHSIKRALTRIEAYHEIGLSSKQSTGHIFALKNRGWKDKIEVDQTINDKTFKGFTNLKFNNEEE